MTPRERECPVALVAPDSFKGTFSAREVAEAMSDGLTTTGWSVDVCPIGDGGEGTLDALAHDFPRRGLDVADPLGRSVSAEFAICEDIAVIEAAAASGLGLVAENERDPVSATTFGTGQLIVAAVEAGARTVYLGAGGTATTDGGMGAIEAIVAAGGLHGCRLVIMCDVSTPFEQAADVFSAQKGATLVQQRLLSGRLHAIASRLRRDPRSVPRTGAAGGLAGGLWAEFDAELVSGAAFVLDELRFDSRARMATLVITGEGKLDRQTESGKAVSEVARRTRAQAISCYALVGQNQLDQTIARAMGLTDVRTAKTLGELRTMSAAIARDHS